jgi:hypothetical protein
MKIKHYLEIMIIAVLLALIMMGSSYPEVDAEEEVTESNLIIETETDRAVTTTKEIEVEQKKKTYEKVNEVVYTTTSVNVRKGAGKKHKKLVTALPNTKLRRVAIGSNGWDKVKINGKIYYVSHKYLTTKKPSNVAIGIKKQIENSKISSNDLRYMAAIIWAEAGNQCEAGQQAVGIVVMNRVRSTTYKNTVYDVIYEKGQFSPVKDGNLNKALARYDRGDMPEVTINAAKYALKGNTTITYNGTTYDIDGYIAFSRYVKNAKLVIQDHMFK